jgi:protein-S-isoprenylcysteine O-methyltransferase Ste14
MGLIVRGTVVVVNSNFLVMIFRVSHEEEVMIDRFGEDYRRYMHHTIRFVPFFF